VVITGRPRRFFLHLAQRTHDAAIVIRPCASPPIDPLPSVKRMIALLAEAVERAHPDVEIAHSTIRDAFSDRYRYQPDPQRTSWDPLLSLDALGGQVEWESIYGRPGSVEIEIGSGKGSFLIAAAAQRSDVNFLSIERARRYAEHLRDRVSRHDLRNVRIVRADAGRFLAERVVPGSVRALHIYFPDPWPKKRHRKRRLITPGFVAAAAQAIESGGEIRFVTDHARYFAAATATFEANSDIEATSVPEAEMTDLTNYERKYRAEGRTIHRARYRRVTPT
jgi:tRNA (guanine-N7-)-methyltransferase